MKDDLTNKIVGSIRAKGGFPLVVKVKSQTDIPFNIGEFLLNILSFLVHELRRFEGVSSLLS